MTLDFVFPKQIVWEIPAFYQVIREHPLCLTTWLSSYLDREWPGPLFLVLLAEDRGYGGLELTGKQRIGKRNMWLFCFCPYAVNPLFGVTLSTGPHAKHEDRCVDQLVG